MNNIVSMILSNFNSKKIAIKDEDTSISYKELYEVITKISETIQEKIGRNKTIGIYGRKSVNYILLMLSIMKSGNYFLPLSNKYPQERIEYMLQATNCANVFLCSKYEIFDHSIDLNCTVFEELVQNTNDREKDGSTCTGGYIIFTSGSTGNPKGVKVSIDALLNTITSMNTRLGNWQQRISNVAVFAPTIFDSCLKSIFLSLCYGKTLVVVQDNLKNNLFNLVKFYKANKIEMTDITPSYFKILTPILIRLDYCPKIFFIGGEKIDPVHLNCVKKLDNKFKEVQCWNTYGPTECTIDVAMNLMNNNGFYDLSVGKPLLNDEIRVMNDGHYCPIGVPGEVILSGKSLADGYVNTHSNSFVKHKGKKFYRTGDTGVWQKNGKLLILGRLDDQIKLHGYRIKISDVEKNIQKIHGVKDAVVLHFNNQLICFVTLIDNQNASDELSEEASQLLPSYMVPTYFKVLKAIPLTSNGKVNKNMLREIYIKENSVKKSKKTNPNIELFMKIWEKVLSTDIDPSANFYDMGGDSLKAIQIISELSEQNINVGIEDILTKSINEISKQNSNNCIKITKKSTLISPMQDWILHRHTKNVNYRNLTFGFKLNTNICISKVAKIIREIMKKHPELRVRFECSNGTYNQYVNPLLELDEINNKILWDFNILSAPLHELVLNMENSMNIARGNLIRVGLYKNLIVFCAHQLVIDHYSFQLLIKEFFDSYFYKKTIADEEVTYPEWISYCQKDNKKIQQNDVFKFEGNNLQYSNLYGNLKIIKKQFSISDKSTIKERILYSFARKIKDYFHNKSFVVGSIGRIQALKEGINIGNTIGRFGNMQEFKIIDSETIEQFKDRFRDFEKKMDINVWLENRQDFKSNVSFNWMGDYTEILNKWDIIPVNVGVSNICPYENYSFDLKFSCYIYQNKLNIEVMYNPQRYRKNLIVNLINTVGEE